MYTAVVSHFCDTLHFVIKYMDSYIGISFVGDGGGVVVGVRISFAVSGDTSVSMKHV